MCYIEKEKFEYKHTKDKKKIIKLGTIVTIQGDIEVLHIEYVIKNILYLKKLL